LFPAWGRKPDFRAVRGVHSGLGLVFVAAQGVLPSLVIFAAAVLLVDLLGLAHLDFHGRTVSDLPMTTGLAVRSVVVALAPEFTPAAW